MKNVCIKKGTSDLFQVPYRNSVNVSLSLDTYLCK